MALRLKVSRIGVLVLGGMLLVAGPLQAQASDPALKSPRNDQFPVTGPFAVPQDLADLLRRSQKQTQSMKTGQPAQLSRDVPAIQGPPGWKSEYDSEVGMTEFFPPDDPDGRSVRLTISDPEVSDDPAFKHKSPRSFHDKLVSAVSKLCLNSGGQPEAPTAPESLGNIVHSKFICVLPDGRRIAKTIYTVTTASSGQLIMLSADEQVHERYVPTVRAMLNPADADEWSADNILFVREGVDVQRQLQTAPEVVAAVDMVRVLKESEVGHGLIRTVKQTSDTYEARIRTLTERVEAGKRQLARESGDASQVDAIRRQTIADEEAMSRLREEFDSVIDNTYLPVLNTMAKSLMQELAPKFGLAAVIVVTPETRRKYPPQLIDLTPLTIMNMTYKYFEDGVVTTHVVPKKTAPKVESDRDTKLFRYLTEKQTRDRNAVMDQSQYDEKQRAERYRQRLQDERRQGELREERRRDELRRDELRREREQADLRREQERREIERQQQRLAEQRMEEQRRQQRLEDQRRDDQRRYDSYRR